MLGGGPTPEPDKVDPELINAGKLPVTEDIGAAYFSSSESFAMIRGGHVSVAVLGVLQVDRLGRIANWAIPGKPILGVGGAMDLLVGAQRVIVATTHMTKTGEAKVGRECGDGVALIEVADGFTQDWVRERTTAPYRTRMRSRT